MRDLRPYQAGFLAILTLFVVACGGLSDRLASDDGHRLDGAWLGEIVMARSMEADGAPDGVTDTFAPDEPIIYVIAEVKRVEEGTTLSAVWSQADETIETSDPIVADQTYEDTYLEFHLEPVGDTELEPGAYSVQLFVNETPGPTVEFTIRKDS